MFPERASSFDSHDKNLSDLGDLFSFLLAYKKGKYVFAFLDLSDIGNDKVSI